MHNLFQVTLMQGLIYSWYSQYKMGFRFISRTQNTKVMDYTEIISFQVLQYAISPETRHY